MLQQRIVRIPSSISHIRRGLITRVHIPPLQCVARIPLSIPPQLPIDRRRIQAREFHVNARKLKDHHFDTLKFVQRLREEGFSEEQSVALMRAMSDVIEERFFISNTCGTTIHSELTWFHSIQNLTRTMVLKEDQEKITYNRAFSTTTANPALT